MFFKILSRIQNLKWAPSRNILSAFRGLSSEQKPYVEVSECRQLTSSYQWGAQLTTIADRWQKDNRRENRNIFAPLTCMAAALLVSGNGTDDRTTDPFLSDADDSESGVEDSQGLTDSSDESQPMEGSSFDVPDDINISQQTADQIYNMAGQVTVEDKSSIFVEDYPHAFTPESKAALKAVLEDLQLSFTLSPFQEIAVNGLLNGLDVLVIVPTGSGKMLVVYLFALALRKYPGLENAVVIVGQPLTSIMTDQLGNPLCPVAVLSMDGNLKSSGCYEALGSPNLSIPLEDITAGKIPVIFGHPESFCSSMGQALLIQLKELKMTRGLILDEFHQGQTGHWETFRSDMVDKIWRQQVWLVKGAPVAAMTATSLQRELDSMIKSMGRRSKPMILADGPIQSQFKVFVLRRPSSQYPMTGLVNAEGEFKSGLLQQLRRIVLDKLVVAIREGLPFKKVIIFFRTQEQAGVVHSWLAQQTGYRLCDTAPFVQNHSSVTSSDDAVMMARSQNIICWLTTNRMLLGRDIPDIDTVIMVRPPDMIHSIVQAMGRAGRRSSSSPGVRKNCVFYLLYNSQDIGPNKKGLSEEVRNFCLSKDCHIELLRQTFVGGYVSEVDHNQCCGNCLMKTEE